MKVIPGIRMTGCSSDMKLSCCMQSTPGSVADVLWAAAVLDVRAPAAFSRLRELAVVLETAQLDARTLQRLFQAHMALERSSGAEATEQGVSLLPPEILEKARAAWQAKLSATAVTQVSLLSASAANQSSCRI